VAAGAVVNWADDKQRTALHVAAGDAVLLAVKVLLQAGADPNMQDAQGMSPLHRAAAANLRDSVAVISALVAAGADTTALDRHGRSAADIASSRATHAALGSRTAPARSATVDGGENTAPTDHSPTDVAAAAITAAGAADPPLEPEVGTADAGESGGWSARSVGRGVGGVSVHGAEEATRAQPQGRRRCDFEVVAAPDMSPARFVRDYLSRRRPVLIRGAVDAWRRSGLWSRANLTQLLSSESVKLAAGAVPYAHHYGIAESPTTIRGYLRTLDQFESRLHSMMGTGFAIDGTGNAALQCQKLQSLLHNRSALKSLAIPSYVFDGQIEGKLPFVARMFGAIPAFVETFDTVLTQFALGSALTGAQPHFHGDAWNALVYACAPGLAWLPTRR
jgi:hypothetical protein